LLVFRLSRRPFALPLSGKGAALRGGRWNSPGVELIYTACNRSLAMAEVAVHLTLATLPDDYVMISIIVPDELSRQEWKESELPPDWKNFPHPASTRRFGDDFVLQGSCALLQVPSAVTAGDYNLLINPHHPDFSRIAVGEVLPFPLDKRMVR
jgi:RES domain-containing protein